MFEERQRPVRKGSILAGALVVSVVMAMPAQAAPTNEATGASGTSVQQAEDLVRALIVRYERGYRPKGTVLGASKVTGSQRHNLILGDGLGERMWRVDFKVPVSKATAQRVARQLASSAAVEFAELDSRVTTVRTTSEFGVNSGAGQR